MCLTIDELFNSGRQGGSGYDSATEKKETEDKYFKYKYTCI